MTNYFSIRDQFCPNNVCSFFGQKLSGNVYVHSSRNKRFRCKKCGKTWVLYKNDLRYGLRTNLQKVDFAQKLLQGGGSVRLVASRVEVSPSTVQRWKQRFKNNHNYFLTF